MDWDVGLRLFQCFNEKVGQINWNQNERKALSCRINYSPGESLILLHKKAPCLYLPHTGNLIYYHLENLNDAPIV